MTSLWRNPGLLGAGELPRKTGGTECVKGLPWEALPKLAPDSLLTSPRVLPFAEFALCPFAGENLSLMTAMCGAPGVFLAHHQTWRGLEDPITHTHLTILQEMRNLLVLKLAF